jgi:hypothetical protein
MKQIKHKHYTKLTNINKINLYKKFKIFYKFRFDKDFLKNNTDKKKYKKKESFNWFENNHKNKILLAINYNTKIVGLIIYNLNNYYYSIIIKKKFRNKKIGKKSIIKFINYLKKRNLKLKTLVNKKNIKSIFLHDQISKNRKNYNKKFFLYDII